MVFKFKTVLLTCAAMLVLLPIANLAKITHGQAAASGQGTAIPSHPSVKVIAPDELLQLNNLVVQSVSTGGASAEIIASFPYAYPIPQGTTGNTMAPQATAPASNSRCFKFNNESDSSGTSVTCPLPPASSAAPQSNAPMIPGAAPAPTIMPPVQLYRLEISSDTRLLLRDRTPAALGDFSAGDKINVFGFYNSDGTIRTLVIRNLSKPAETNFIQLNNATLISVSSADNVATLVVAQNTVNPCYSFGASGVNAPIAYPCPYGLGSSSPTAGSATVPQSLIPMWQLARKYEVHADTRTVFIDRLRGIISLADLRVGDSLNIYGEMTGESAPINADLVRDLDIPATPAIYNGTVTQVNSDGSFAMTLSDGTMVTVKTPLATGMNIQIKGILDRVQNVLSQVSQIVIGEQVVSPVPIPVPLPAPAPTKPILNSGQ